MFYEPKTLIVVYKDEMLAHQMQKLIAANDAVDVNVIAWTEKIWLANKKAGNINSKVLFLGDIKGVNALIPVIDVKFEKHGVCYGWAGDQAVIYVKPNEIKSIENYHAFHTELESMPAPPLVKDSIKPKLVPIKETKVEKNTSAEENEAKGILGKGRRVFKKIGNAVGDAYEDISVKAFVFSAENFKNKKALERQMLFFGVIKLYNEGLETFINS